MVIDSLIEYINTHSDWQESLKKPPYNLKSVKNDPAHPTHWMFVYNLFDSDFSLPEVCASRGTVLDVNPETGKVDGVVCHAFDKFFNYGDPHQAQIDWSTARVLEKRDGQLIKISRYKGEVLYFTNGAFGLNTPLTLTDDKVQSYWDLFKLAAGPDLLKFFEDETPEGWTLMFELTSQYNRIIVKYDRPLLTFLGARNEHGFEMRPEECERLFNRPFNTVSDFGVRDMASIQHMLDGMSGQQEEGFVICDATFNRVKIKCQDYLRIKYLLGEDGITNDRLFLAIITNETDDLLEFDPSLQPQIDFFKSKIELFKAKIEKMAGLAKAKLAACPDRKTYAEWALAQPEGKLWFDLLKWGPDSFERYMKSLAQAHPYTDFCKLADKVLG